MFRIPVTTQEPVQTVNVEARRQVFYKIIQVDATTNNVTPTGGFIWEILSGLIEHTSGQALPLVLGIYDRETFTDTMIAYLDVDVINGNYPLCFIMDMDTTALNKRLTMSSTPTPIVVSEAYNVGIVTPNTDIVHLYVRETKV